MEWQDFVFPFRFVGEAPEGSYISRWNDLILEAAARTPRPWTNSANYRRFFDDAGFVDVTEKQIFLPTNTWAKGKYYKILGIMFKEYLTKGIEADSLRLFTGVLGWDIERLRELLRGVKREFADTAVHCYLTV